MIRSVLAIAVGFFFIAALSLGADAVMMRLIPGAYGPGGAVTSPGVLVAIMAYVAAFAVAGSYLAARLAPSHPMRHALILGVLGLLVNIGGAIAMWDTAPSWFHGISILLVMPYAWLGGRLREVEIARGGITAGPRPAL